MTSQTQNLNQLLFDSRPEFSRIVTTNQFNLDVSREIDYITEQVRLNHNKMFDQSRSHLSLSAATPFSMQSCIALGLEMGLSFSTQRDFLHLIPRYSSVLKMVEATLMIGFRGYKKIAADAGAFSRIDTQLIYSNDFFEFQGVDQPVIHKVNVLSPALRGNIIGGYCMAKIKNPDFPNEMITTVMSPEELFAIEKNATSKGGYSPWTGPFKTQMYLKSIIRRSWKDWEYYIEQLGLCSAVIQRVGDHHKREELIINNGQESSSTMQKVAV